jgi:hypothetical protein
MAEKAFPGGALDDPRELPPQVHGVLEADLQPLATSRRMNVGGVAGQQHASIPVRLG